MIEYGSHCPFCELGYIGIDCDNLKVVFNPDRNSPYPCQHLACFHGSLETNRSCRGKCDVVPDRSRWWIWVRDQPSPEDFSSDDPDSNLAICLFDVTLDKIPLDSPQPFLVTGGLAIERERRRPGSGDLLITIPGREPMWALLDFWGVYSAAPHKFAAALMEMLRRHY